MNAWNMSLLNSNSMEKIGIRWGIYTFLMLSAYFLLMKIAGLVHILELRFLNAFIMFFGCYKAIRTTKDHVKPFRYFKGLGAGSLNALVSSSLFTLFGILYITVIDPAFMQELKQNEPLGLYFNKYVAIIQIFIEGIGSGFIFSFIIMQWMKKPRILSEE
jgi:hypothetical protein